VFALVVPLVRVPVLPTAVLAMHQGALLDGRTNGAVFVGLPQFASVFLLYASVRTAPHLASFCFDALMGLDTAASTRPSARLPPCLRHIYVNHAYFPR
jgi:hypothetical protein